jgi:DNA-binding NarL/FixJ family response regulator
MLSIAFIAELNQTNNIILEMVEQNYTAETTFYKPSHILKAPPAVEDLEADIILFDLNTSSGMGNVQDHIKSLNQLFENSPILIIHPYEHKSFVQPLIEAGARGIIPVAPTEMEFTQAIDEILGGKSFVSFPDLK